MKRTMFIVGTDTGVGKTVLTTMLVHHLKRTKVGVNALKPFCSGSRDDVMHLAAALGDGPSLDAINPYFFADPITPLVAARKAGRVVTLAECLAVIRSAKLSRVLLVEGAGGLMSPLGQGFDTLSLVRKTSAVVVLVAPNRLGVLNQVFLNLSILKRANRLPGSVVLMGQKKGDESVPANAGLIREAWPQLNVLEAPYLGAEPLAKQALKESYKKLKKTLAAVMGCP